jgi:hypothetical protein
VYAAHRKAPRRKAGARFPEWWLTFPYLYEDVAMIEKIPAAFVQYLAEFGSIRPITTHQR